MKKVVKLILTCLFVDVNVTIFYFISKKKMMFIFYFAAAKNEISVAETETKQAQMK